MAGVMVVPSLMPFLSLVLPVRLNRWLNIIFGGIYSLVMVVAFKSSWYFYILFGVIEMIAHRIELASRALLLKSCPLL
jgi:hypothetical protein